MEKGLLLPFANWPQIRGKDKKFFPSADCDTIFVSYDRWKPGKGEKSSLDDKRKSYEGLLFSVSLCFFNRNRRRRRWKNRDRLGHPLISSAFHPILKLNRHCMGSFGSANFPLNLSLFFFFIWLRRRRRNKSLLTQALILINGRERKKGHQSETRESLFLYIFFVHLSSKTLRRRR